MPQNIFLSYASKTAQMFLAWHKNRSKWRRFPLCEHALAAWECGNKAEKPLCAANGGER
jgi:hypothetical protein